MIKSNNIYSFCIVFVILFISAYNARAAQASSGFSFGGTSTLTGHYTSHQTFGNQLPSEYLTWQLRSRLTLFHIPLNVSSVLSTQQRRAAQSMNHVSVSLDIRSFSRHIRTTDRLRFLGGVETFELGRTRPVYSRLMLQGIPVNGANVAWRTGVLHTALVYGTSRRPVGRGAYMQQQHHQTIAFGRMGVGYEDRTFVAFSVLHAGEDTESIEPVGRTYRWDADTLIHHMDTLFIKPDSSQVFRKAAESLLPGIELGTTLFGQRLSLGGELVGMMHTSNKESQHFDTDRVPTAVDRIHPIRLSTSLSYAHTLHAQLQFSNTRLQASYRKISPGFQSPGTPFMRQDQRQYHLRARQSLFNRRLSIQSHYRTMEDNLLDQRRSATYTTIWGVTASWRQTGLPWVSISFSPHRQEMDDEVSPSLNKALVMSVSAGLNYSLQEIVGVMTSLSYSNQQTSISNVAGYRDFQGHNISLQQSLRFTIPLQLSANGGLFMMESDKEKTTSYQVMVRGKYDISQQWMVSVGARHFNQGRDRKRWGARVQTAYDFGRYGKLQLLAEPLYYRDLLNPMREYDQYSVRVSFVNSW